MLQVSPGEFHLPIPEEDPLVSGGTRARCFIVRQQTEVKLEVNNTRHPDENFKINPLLTSRFNPRER